jgi:hypothetical protein
MAGKWQPQVGREPEHKWVGLGGNRTW